ncbi:hypothetical protein [Helicovermis profundi]|uniref:Uncharacterized protein n=1 Tax=Helicovermis profundi TaxID=3065157 RepID=A0AAU9EA95_9FIRM|nr:hypothetical protein HLPR_05350 [Clostridia bacterium S502]
MKKEHIKLGALLITFSIIMYITHFLIFRNLEHLFIFLISDIAFVPLEVFLVSLVIEQLIEKQEEQKIIKKMNMLVGMFYQEIGNELLTFFVNADIELEKNKDCLMINFDWKKENYKNLKNIVKKHSHDIDFNKIKLDKLHLLLKKNRDLIVNLITNPVLLEKEYFSDVLMSIFHLLDELESRDYKKLSKEDNDHMKVDAKRVYEFLSIEWVVYMEQLQMAYPYLFFTALKNNPYDSREGSEIEKEIMLKINNKIEY